MLWCTHTTRFCWHNICLPWLILMRLRGHGQQFPRERSNKCKNEQEWTSKSNHGTKPHVHTFAFCFAVGLVRQLRNEVRTPGGPCCHGYWKRGRQFQICNLVPQFLQSWQIKRLTRTFSKTGNTFVFWNANSCFPLLVNKTLLTACDVCQTVNRFHWVKCHSLSLYCFNTDFTFSIKQRNSFPVFCYQSFTVAFYDIWTHHVKKEKVSLMFVWVLS